jgi:DNA-binding transcriptional regulator YiaG
MTRPPIPRYLTETCLHCGAGRRRLNGAWVRRRREKLGLSGSAVAESLGMTRQYLALLETGQRPVTPELERVLMKRLRLKS